MGDASGDGWVVWWQVGESSAGKEILAGDAGSDDADDGHWCRWWQVGDASITITLL